MKYFEFGTENPELMACSTAALPVSIRKNFHKKFRRRTGAPLSDDRE